MKHKFECGIIGTSHDSAGDSFLLGMKMREESEARMRRLAIDAASAPLLRRELRAAHETIVVLLKMQGARFSFRTSFMPISIQTQRPISLFGVTRREAVLPFLTRNEAHF